ncbi:GNAT family N-acetyltransferase [Candidatus Bathyarchaeota archaeon]|nr:GNAT family N-acetyltransferase [Candidatus Bathyarchaeota archaeon]MBL7079401.1 GNAT family N-acetyltransferase [Candidatus Bathyarchaeota archaeon]
MSEAYFVPYDDDIHRDQFFNLNLEYLSWINDLVYERHGIRINPGGSVREYLESVFPKMAVIVPPEGIIYIIEVEGMVDGMGVLRRIEGSVGEIKRMYIRPKIRGKGYGKEMLRRLEDMARELGFSTLRLDTGDFMEVAQHIYRKAGFVEIGKYSGGEWVDRNDTEDVALYMEKKL